EPQRGAELPAKLRRLRCPPLLSSRLALVSEVEPESPLQLAHRSREARDRTAGVAVDEGVRLREVRAVEYVVALEPQLERQVLRDAEALREVEIEGLEGRTRQAVSRRVAEGVEPWRRVRARVEPLVGIGILDRGIADEVGPDGAEGPRVGLVPADE